MSTKVSAIYNKDKKYIKCYKGSTLEYYTKEDVLNKFKIRCATSTNITIALSVTGDIGFTPSITIQKNAETPVTISAGESTTIYLPSNSILYLYGTNPYLALNSNNYTTLKLSGGTSSYPVCIYGNIGSLIDGTGNMAYCTSNYQFCGLFNGNNSTGSKLQVRYGDLVLPDANGYDGVFQNFLRSADFSQYNNYWVKMSGVGNAAYAGMFYGNSQMTSAPSLPVPEDGVIPNVCYANMFNKCTLLSDISNLQNLFANGVTLGSSSMLQMFYQCTKITSTPTIKINNFAGVSACEGMFYGCTALTTNNITLADDCNTTTSCMKQMFFQCSALTSIPVLTPKVIAESAYLSLVAGAKKINYIKCLATDISAENATYNWVADVASSGKFVRPAASADIWTSGVSGIPSGWTVTNA